jgi:hypothetical protein
MLLTAMMIPRMKNVNDEPLASAEHQAGNPASIQRQVEVVSLLLPDHNFNDVDIMKFFYHYRNRQ